MSDAVRVVTASVAGASHTLNSLPCQDAVDWFVDDDSAHVAMADGLGSAAFSAEGAAVAVKAAIAFIRSQASGASDMSHLCHDAMEEARASVLAECQRRFCEPRDMACTLIVASLREGTLVTAHIGDGGAVALTTLGVVLASPPGDSEYVNEVDHLCLDSFADFIRIAETPGVSMFAVFTDGIQRAVLTKHDGQFHVHEGFFNPIFEWASEGGEADELSRLLEGSKLTEVSDDDKTLAVVSSSPSTPAASADENSSGSV